MHPEGELGNWREPTVSLSETPGERGHRLTKSPGGGRALLTASEPTRGTQTEGADKGSGSERQAKRPERGCRVTGGPTVMPAPRRIFHSRTRFRASVIRARVIRPETRTTIYDASQRPAPQLPTSSRNEPCGKCGIAAKVQMDVTCQTVFVEIAFRARGVICTLPHLIQQANRVSVSNFLL
jgi:hypothetical protein